ncbi:MULTISPECIES: alpha/beta hydrolase [Bizionia]|uniref:Alpha/beta hydrolase n=1 Tax=Bizionia algoritergicola TaxID=291187 RepID=A0A5D0QV97_9FLAO|nr:MULTISPECIES: alpha/beta hydrolase [Bizionia]OBX22900.1 esterase [Bizionia sp. APA-3]TYB72789.1 alpha/beta hydrolase [Bizionia algoritergicola]
MNTKIGSLLLFSILLCNCASRKIKDVAYLKSADTKTTMQPALNVFEPKNSKAAKNPVVIFVHGGYWTEGDKNTYGFLGRNFAKSDVVTVIAGYTLSPNANYDSMAKEIAQAVNWTVKNIEKYKGDPEQIYVMGHSAGGHLIALIATNPKYLENKNVLKGVILNDAAGLDMKTYLDKNPPTSEHHYDVTWTKDPANWKDASPIYFMDESMPPFLIYVGEKTYNSIISQNEAFVAKLKTYQPDIEPIFLNKKHVPMMSQFIFPWNKRYDEILQFIKSDK